MTKKKSTRKRAPSAAPGQGGIRDRVTELRKVRASELMKNEANWRMHPESQRSALRAMLEDVGYADALIARETPEGLQLLDGHLRAEVTPECVVPVLIVDLDDEEANKVLLTLDPLANMAVADPLKLKSLAVEFTFDDHAELRKMVQGISRELQKMEKEEKEEERQDHDVPGMELQPHEHYDYLVVLATTSREWNIICERLSLEKRKRRGSLGTCRAIRAEKLIELLKEND